MFANVGGGSVDQSGGKEGNNIEDRKPTWDLAANIEHDQGGPLPNPTIQRGTEQVNQQLHNMEQQNGPISPSSSSISNHPEFNRNAQETVNGVLEELPLSQRQTQQNNSPPVNHNQGGGEFKVITLRNDPHTGPEPESTVPPMPMSSPMQIGGSNRGKVPFFPRRRTNQQYGGNSDNNDKEGFNEVNI
jgi:hypothetical protein